MCPKITMQKGRRFLYEQRRKFVFVSFTKLDKRKNEIEVPIKHTRRRRVRWKFFCTVSISNNSIFKFMLIVNLYLQISKYLFFLYFLILSCESTKTLFLHYCFGCLRKTMYRKLLDEKSNKRVALLDNIKALIVSL